MRPGRFELGATGRTTRSHDAYVYGGERLVAVVTRKDGEPEARLDVHVDHLGSIDVLTNEAGGVEERRSYDAFGARRNPKWGEFGPPPSFTSKTTRGFTGHEADEALGLVNAKGRIYDPQIGRFITPDPFVSRPLSSQSRNRYAYTLNNPLAYVDPSGFSEEELGGDDAGLDIDLSTYKGPFIDVIAGPGAPLDEEEPDVCTAAEVGATSAPIDVAAYGNSAGFAPEPSPTITEQPAQPSVGRQVGIGIAQGVTEIFAAGTETIVLNGLTGGSYTGLMLGASIWAGYQEEGLLGAFMAVNPFASLGKAGAETYVAAENGDYQEASRKGAHVVPLLAATIATVAGGLASVAGKSAGAATEAGAAEAGTSGAARGGAHLNTNTATSRFGIYEIRINGELYKIGKADLNRTTQSSGLPTRVHQQVRALEKIHGTRNVRGRVVEDLGETTTAQAKAAELARIHDAYEGTGEVPLGNQRSFKP